MKTISIRQLHHETGRWVRKAAALGEIHVSERGKTIAKIVPQTAPPEVPYFARRKMSRRFRNIMEKLTLHTRLQIAAYANQRETA